MNFALVDSSGLGAAQLVFKLLYSIPFSEAFISQLLALIVLEISKLIFKRLVVLNVLFVELDLCLQS